MINFGWPLGYPGRSTTGGDDVSGELTKLKNFVLAQMRDRDHEIFTLREELGSCKRFLSALEEKVDQIDKSRDEMVKKVACLDTAVGINRNSYSEDISDIEESLNRPDHSNSFSNPRYDDQEEWKLYPSPDSYQHTDDDEVNPAAVHYREPLITVINDMAPSNVNYPNDSDEGSSYLENCEQTTLGTAPHSKPNPSTTVESSMVEPEMSYEEHHYSSLPQQESHFSSLIRSSDCCDFLAASSSVDAGLMSPTAEALMQENERVTAEWEELANNSGCGNSGMDDNAEDNAGGVMSEVVGDAAKALCQELIDDGDGCSRDGTEGIVDCLGSEELGTVAAAAAAVEVNEEDEESECGSRDPLTADTSVAAAAFFGCWAEPIRCNDEISSPSTPEWEEDDAANSEEKEAHYSGDKKSDNLHWPGFGYVELSVGSPQPLSPTASHIDSPSISDAESGDLLIFDSVTNDCCEKVVVPEQQQKGDIHQGSVFSIVVEDVQTHHNEVQDSPIPATATEPSTPPSSWEDPDTGARSPLCHSHLPQATGRGATCEDLSASVWTNHIADT